MPFWVMSQVSNSAITHNINLTLLKTYPLNVKSFPNIVTQEKPKGGMQPSLLPCTRVGA